MDASPVTGPDSLAGRKEWIGLAVLALPTLLLSMDMTVLYLAIPHISADLHPTANQLLWITDIYGFLVAGFLITMGNLGDRIGRRRLLMIGAVGFAAASVLGAYASSPEMLIAARALMGVAGATLMPSTLALIRNMFHDDGQRTQAIAIWMSAFMVGSIIGPLVGGALLEQYAWGSVFLLAVPVMVLLLATAPFLLPEYKDPHPGPLDLWSVGLSLAAIIPIIYGIKELAHAGRDGLSGVPMASLVLGLAAGAIFVHRQRTLESPLLDLALFANPRFSASLATLALTLFAMAGVFFFTAQYLQLVMGLSPFRAGLWTIPQMVAMLAAAGLTPSLAKRIRPAYLMSAGLVIAALGMGIVTTLDAGSSLWLLALSQGVIALGMGPTFILGLDMIVGTAPPERAGAASAISETAQEFGFALGVAVLGSVGGIAYRATLDERLPAGLAPEQTASARETIANALEVAATLPEALGTELVTVARAAFVDGMRLDAWIALIMTLAVAALPLAFLRHVRPASEAAAEGAPHAEPAAVNRATAYE
jgi:DHA2 family multidrug resistance protein-like MFS transporter